MNEHTNNISDKSDNTPAFEQALVSQIAKDFLREQRRSRRWGIFFKLLLTLYLFSFLALYLAKDFEIASLGGGMHTALVDINGIITVDSQASADHVITGIRAAFKNDKTAGIILRINSPGGSPVQAGYINDEINRLKAKYPDIPVYAVIRDLCAPGGYYIASAADKIYADKASIVGSIGVIMSGFGFVDAIEKLGVERRLLQAGENKDFMDPFSPLKQKDIQHIDTLLADIHQQFIDVVKEGRGDRLVDDDKLFSGLIWTGEQAIELGLVDELGSSSYVAREVIGVEDIVDFTYRENYLDRFADSLGAAMLKHFNSMIKMQLK